MKLHAITLLLSLFSASSYAIVDGTPVDWESMDDVVGGNCTGTIIAGKYVLTAAHCYKNGFVGFSSGEDQYLPDENMHNHPDYSDGKQHDVSVWALLDPVPTTSVHFFANLNTDPVKHDDIIKTYGFGGHNPLAYADSKIDTSDPDDATDMQYKGLEASNGYVTWGDSGGMWLNQDDKIVSINNSISGMSGDNSSFGANLSENRDFILEEINGWHYATLAKTDSNGKATITVQSLHAAAYGSVNDMAYITNGHAEIVGGTCYNSTNIQPFTTCTYEIESTGGESSLYLGSDKNGNEEIVTINKVAPTPPSSGDSDGGSLGFLSVLGLLGLGLIRKRTE